MGLTEQTVGSHRGEKNVGGHLLVDEQVAVLEEERESRGIHTQGVGRVEETEKAPLE